MINPIWKEKWLAALRSGKYGQGTGKLRDDRDNYCCLGVFCDIYGPSLWEKRPDCNDYLFDGYYDELTSEIMDDLGLEGREMSDLIEMNDVSGDDFLTIADYIQENL